jgi:1,4-alpha-glucan branching enzyme
MGWMHDSLHYIAKDPSYRPYHHNEITFSMVYAFDESFVLPISHDEVVHGKGSLLRKMPGDEWQQAANLRVYAAFMYAHPGKKLNFMGNEIGQAAEWNHDSSVNWHLLDYAKHQGIQALYKDLNKAYIQYPALYELDHSAEGFEWIDQGNSQQSVLSVLRKSIGQKQKVYVLMNFTSRTYDNFKLGVQDPGEYALILNTDDKKYWGSDYPTHQDPTAITEPWQGQPGFIEVNLPPLGALFILHKG